MLFKLLNNLDERACLKCFGAFILFLTLFIAGRMIGCVANRHRLFFGKRKPEIAQIALAGIIDAALHVARAAHLSKTDRVG